MVPNSCRPSSRAAGAWRTEPGPPHLPFPWRTVKTRVRRRKPRASPSRLVPREDALRDGCVPAKPFPPGAGGPSLGPPPPPQPRNWKARAVGGCAHPAPNPCHPAGELPAPQGAAHPSTGATRPHSPLKVQGKEGPGAMGTPPLRPREQKGGSPSPSLKQRGTAAPCRIVPRAGAHDPGKGR